MGGEAAVSFTERIRFPPKHVAATVFHRLYAQAWLHGASSHSGWRTFVTTLIENGVDIKAISTLIGHASSAMTTQYVEDNPAQLKPISVKQVSGDARGGKLFDRS
ncbi:tyrosine-type recombinase/integrase [Ralstonia solanacearum]|uniref:tyrosine-type recombinase/integrase n=1 Tax=Ralstonia solanacearum TaxID=305 RepID=UPI0009BA90C3|nr:hypothetical protein C2124_16885 [Ralstonia solanacearum]MBB6589556.1 tyrosine-type recombinase/integrase [Ralstonia solanacearum]MDB0534783.1 tyrosine-type recombinase/integrase [Ralstonia solanacearum]MDB0539529.1 tyrosine-type recombinase/integrase [Ralstonia solanacearum]MDB0549366.1 tyrosine-type recombinase/integrase [Ralstonia solanacearum]